MIQRKDLKTKSCQNKNLDSFYQTKTKQTKVDFK